MYTRTSRYRGEGIKVEDISFKEGKRGLVSSKGGDCMFLRREKGTGRGVGEGWREKGLRGEHEL